MRLSKRPDKIVDFASFVLQRRIDKKLSAEKLGELAGFTGSYICRLENRKQFPPLKTIAKICSVLGAKERQLSRFLSDYIHMIGWR